MDDVLDYSSSQSMFGHSDMDAEQWVAHTNTHTNGEITSLISNLYDGDDDDDDSVPANYVLGGVNEGEYIGQPSPGMNSTTPMSQATQTDYNEVAEKVAILTQQLNTLDLDFRDSVSSAVNREIIFREYVSTSLAKLESQLMANLAELEKEMCNCLLRRDEQWKKQLSKLKPSSIPLAHDETSDSPDIIPVASPRSPKGLVHLPAILLPLQPL